MKGLDRETCLQKMRDSYTARDLKSLRRQFAISQWFLTDDDKVKIQRAIDKLEKDRSGLHPLIAEALDMLGGRIIEE